MGKRPSRGYRRTSVIGAGALVVSSFAWVVGIQPGAAAPAVEAAPAVRGQSEVTGGQINGVANVVKWAPGSGALEFGVTEGTSVTEVINRIAQAQSKTLDFGLIGLAATAEGCDSDGDGKPDDATVTPDQLPQGTRVDNREGDAEDRQEFTEQYGSSGGTGGGTEFVKATVQPYSQAITTTEGREFGPVLTIGNGRSEVVTQTRNGGVHQAFAQVDASIDIAGVVKMENLHWEGLHRTGGDGAVEGSFDAGRITQAGIAAPLPTEGQAAEAAINAALLTSGIRVVMPRVERLTDPADLLRVTPMIIVIEDSPAGATLVGPGLNLTRVQRENLFDSLVALDCANAGRLLVGEIVVGVAAGTGFMAFEVGGVTVSSAEATFTNPFALGPAPAPLPLPPPEPVETPGPVTPPASVSNTGASPSGGGTVAAVAAAPASEVTALERFCESIHPFGWPPCSEGAAVVLGLLGLGATVGMGVLDWRHQQRGVRDSPDPIWSERRRGVPA